MHLLFQLEGELTRDGLRAVRDQLNELLGELPATEPRDPREAATRKAAELANNLGDKTWDLLYVGARRSDNNEEFTLANLAEALGVPIETAKAWHRAASKVINRVNKTMPTPEVFNAYWDGAQQVYSMDPQLRRAIIEMGPYKQHFAE